MKITFITTFPKLDIQNWSGIEFFMANKLEREHDLSYIQGLETNWSSLLKIKARWYGLKGAYLAERSPEIGLNYARQILAQLEPSTDIIFSPGTIPLAYLDTKKPKVFYTDATFASMMNYYPGFSTISKKSIEEGLAAEKRALETSSLAIYSSDWAANSAIKDFNIDPNKVKVIPFGANILTKSSLSQIKDSLKLKAKDSSSCKILFLGVEWYRKGGDIVLETVKYLNEVMRLPTELHIVGIDDLAIKNLPSFVFNHGRINKATPDGMKKIENLLRQSHFLFVPSRAEAYGIVFVEAMSFGIPCVSRNTGGIPTIIKNDSNGIILDYNATCEQYAEQIYNAFLDKKRYEELSLAAFNDTEIRLNWNVAMDTATKYMRDI